METKARRLPWFLEDKGAQNFNSVSGLDLCLRLPFFVCITFNLRMIEFGVKGGDTNSL